MDDDLPESWRKALKEQDAKPREPIQPIFRAWHALLAALLPVAGAYAAATASFAIHAPFPNFPAAIPFYALLMFGNGFLIARAIGIEESHFAFAARSAFVGMACFCFSSIPYVAEVSIVMLAAYIVARLIGRMGHLAVVFIGIIGIVGILLAVPLAIFFAQTATSTLLTDSTRLALAMVTAYPLAHALRTAALPAEPTFFGRLDATFSGISSALLGLFAGLVAYRISLLLVQLANYFWRVESNKIAEFAAACCGLAAGNCMCLWMHFKTAYSARAESAPRKRIERTVATITPPAMPIPPPKQPAYTRTTVEEMDVDDLT